MEQAKRIGDAFRAYGISIGGTAQLYDVGSSIPIIKFDYYDELR
jgi:hypothetical protein